MNRTWLSPNSRSEAHIYSVDIQDSLGVGNEAEVDHMCQGPHCIPCQQGRPELVLEGLLDLVRLPCMWCPSAFKTMSHHLAMTGYLKASLPKS